MFIKFLGCERGMDAVPEEASPPLGELAKVLQQLEQAPERVLEVLERIREVKLNKMELPEPLLSEFQALAEFVHSPAELKKRGFWEYLLLDDYSLSYATPQKFGAHRAERISALFPEMKVADVSCGVGGQLLELGKVGIETIGLEKDPLRYALAKINVQLAVLKNYVQFKPVLYNEDALSTAAAQLTEKSRVVLCDSLRGGKEKPEEKKAGGEKHDNKLEEDYSPSLGELQKFYSGKDLVYEFRPRENPAELLKRHSFLFRNCELEYYGEGERCSRLTAYVGKGNIIRFFQEDEALSANLSYKHERLESLQAQTLQRLGVDFPQHDFYLVNRGIIENYFAALLPGPLCQLDQKRYVAEERAIVPLKSGKRFSVILSTHKIEEITAFLEENYEDYNVTLRMEIPSEDYWKFVKENKLVAKRDSENKFSLFKLKRVYYLAEEG